MYIPSFKLISQSMLKKSPENADGRTLPRHKARYGGSNMKKINNGGRLLIFYMMEGIKKVNRKNGIL